MSVSLNDFKDIVIKKAIEHPKGYWLDMVKDCVEEGRDCNDCMMFHSCGSVENVRRDLLAEGLAILENLRDAI